ncbi:MAG: hypothetical protein DMG18_16960 [Acidobacteria bacterium]|nr:MAG: hypothetical protein DMG18_16960 [Acidobacteriota bacterium]
MKAKITALVGAMLLVSAGLAADDNPLIGKWKHKGKQIGTVTEVVSKDGKTLTRTQKGANPQGQPIDNVQVLDKQ